VVHVPAHRRRQGSVPSSSREKSKGRPYRRMQWRQQGTWSKLLLVRNQRLWNWKSLNGPAQFAALISIDWCVITALEGANGKIPYWKVLAFYNEIVVPSAYKNLELSLQESINQGCRNSPHHAKIANMGFSRNTRASSQFSDTVAKCCAVECQGTKCMLCLWRATDCTCIIATIGVDVVYRRSKSITIIYVCGVTERNTKSLQWTPRCFLQNVSFRLREPTAFKRKAGWREGTWL
jgi:hypothetical protein